MERVILKVKEWLDEAIKLATWQGEMDRVKALTLGDGAVWAPG